MTIKAFLVFSCVYLGLTCGGCGGNVYLQQSSSATNSDGMITTVRDFQSTLLRNGKSPWRVSVLARANMVDKVYFLNETDIWGIGFKEIFKFSQEDKTWNKAGFLGNVDGIDMILGPKNSGFIVGYPVDKTSSNRSSISGNILMTEDAGKTWKMVYSASSITFAKIAHGSDGKLWAIGRKKSLDNLDSMHFILLSANGGQNWLDVSDNLNEVAKEGRGYVSDYLTDVRSEEDGSIGVLSSDGKVYRSRDEGKSWDLVFKLYGEPEQTRVTRFGRLPDGRLWLAGGTVSTEGVWGMVAVQNNNGTWNRYRLNRFYFSNVEFVSNTEIFAVGSSLAPGSFVIDQNGNKGVVLHTLDSGSNWTVVYESAFSNELTSLSKVVDSKLFVGGKRGEILILEHE